jgi:hypothetical protein
MRQLLVSSPRLNVGLLLSTMLSLLCIHGYKLPRRFVEIRKMRPHAKELVLGVGNIYGRNFEGMNEEDFE